jgi:hypothetical protein
MPRQDGRRFRGGALERPGEQAVSMVIRGRSSPRGTCLLASSWSAMIILLMTYLALRPEGSGGHNRERLVLFEKTSLLKGGVRTRLATQAQAKADAAKVAMTGAKDALKSAKAQGPAALRQRKQRVMMAAACECPYTDNPISIPQINEVNVFPGPSDYGPDAPQSRPDEPIEACCPGGDAWGAPVLSLPDMRKVYEIGEPNYKEWKEYVEPTNSLPGIVDWDPDSPNANMPIEERTTKPLFDGNGGLLGLEDTDGAAHYSILFNLQPCCMHAALCVAKGALLGEHVPVGIMLLLAVHAWRLTSCAVCLQAGSVHPALQRHWTRTRTLTGRTGGTTTYLRTVTSSLTIENCEVLG